jgi:lipid A ethanolaminephosphotransferase
MSPRIAAQRLRAWRPEISIEMLTLLICVYLALTSNASFWAAAIAGKSLSTFGTWRFIVGTFAAMCGLHMAVLLLAATRWTVKPLLAVIVVITAIAAYYQDRYAVFLDPDMVRNVLHTEYQEARELISIGFILRVLLVSAPALLLLWRVRIVRRTWTHASLARALSLGVAIVLTSSGLLLAFRELSSLMRNHKEVRYLVNPGNYLYAASRVLWADVKHAQVALLPLGTDAQVGTRAASARPRLLVVVIGETVRAQNWGLNGYVRDTTPELRALNVVNFSDVRSCGTATEVSLPCLFAPVGRRDYDEARIRGQQSLLHVLDHAGVATLWRDNQTGCKGVCSGLPFQQWRAAEVADFCHDDACFDEILLHKLQDDIDAVAGDMVVVLHPLGNHGPSYYARYPDAFRRYTPTCDSAEPGECSSEALVNSYDNAVLYGDHFVAETIRLLQAQTGRDTALIYVSDHGESLGEHGLYLHGVPYAIAPDQQTKVPMVTWLSDGYASSAGVDDSCLRGRSAQPFAHDNLFHSVLGLLDIQTTAYEPALDLFKPCRAL